MEVNQSKLIYLEFRVLYIIVFNQNDWVIVQKEQPIIHKSLGCLSTRQYKTGTKAEQKITNNATN